MADFLADLLTGKQLTEIIEQRVGLGSMTFEERQELEDKRKLYEKKLIPIGAVVGGVLTSETGPGAIAGAMLGGMAGNGAGYLAATMKFAFDRKLRSILPANSEETELSN